jgi:hypothetical protein
MMTTFLECSLVGILLGCAVSLPTVLVAWLFIRMLRK